jgi:hypothetical protein
VGQLRRGRQLNLSFLELTRPEKFRIVRDLAPTEGGGTLLNRFGILSSLAIFLTLGNSLWADLDPEDIAQFLNAPQANFGKASDPSIWINDLRVESRPHPPHGLAGRRVVLSAAHGRTGLPTRQYAP